MSQPPEFFQQQPPGAWIGFAVFAGLVCFLYPPALGLFIGIGMFYVLFWLIYKALGG